MANILKKKKFKDFLDETPDITIVNPRYFQSWVIGTKYPLQ